MSTTLELTSPSAGLASTMPGTNVHQQRKRPLSITVVGLVFIAAGLVGFVYHLLAIAAPIQVDEILVLGIRVAAIVGGLFVLRGANWARWLLLLWMAIHVVISMMHSVAELIMHVVLFGVITFVLLRAPASAYFRGA